MPALGSALLPDTLHAETAINNVSANATAGDALQVICAWPVSGQYGPGTRVLYYVLIAACVFARKTDWLRNACLAAVLLFPAVAALHGVVIAALNLHGAVDMDIYGAFQLCSIGILTAPVAVRVSRTYFYDPGRNIIFLWTILILAGLLSLTVEFFRIQPTPCPFDDAGNAISPDARRFKYNTQCGMTCSEDTGPLSPMREGAASNIYVIPAPDKITFGTATLMAAACCIPAILSLISMWNKVLEINRMNRFGIGKEEDQVDEPIEGTNGATIKKMNRVNSLVRLFLSAVEIPVLGAAVIGILILGEMNFFSPQVLYQTEPVASIGQWGPIVGAGLAVLGSLYLVLAADLDAVEEEEHPKASSNQDNCSMREINTIASAESSHSPTRGVEMRRSASNTRSVVEQDGQPKPPAGDSGNRRKVARALTKFVVYLSDAAHERLHDSEFKNGKALDFPEIPGEIRRNRALPHIRNQYNTYRDTDWNVTPSLRGRASRAASFTSSIYGLDMESGSRASKPASRSPSPSSSPIVSRRPHASTISGDRAPPEIHNRPPASSGAVHATQRRATLEVPAPTHHSSPRNSSPTSPTHSSRSIPDSRRPPAIVVSSENEDNSTVHRTTSHPPPSPSSPGPISTPPAAASPSSPRHMRQFTL
ncbi:hypothetical protein GX50_07814 [[Emmonsia] crescens]|uniref:Uncharacterized protein n=1 Tax=[Emmonsia] crescens TaxID=73230 RepID=A0A2B7YZA2_9EURO|nr:hypothetical protein GX50_07814 [Emmonsia crescens]